MESKIEWFVKQLSSGKVDKEFVENNIATLRGMSPSYALMYESGLIGAERFVTLAIKEAKDNG
jgi:hypothetical protein